MKVVHCEKEPFDIYIGRKVKGRKASKWANPFKIGVDGTRSEVIQKFIVLIKAKPALMSQLHELDGKVLGCWCGDKPCHGKALRMLREQQKNSIFASM